MTQEREAKRNYKAAFEALARAKVKMEGSAMQEEGLRRDLIKSFDEYFEEKVGVNQATGICTNVSAQNMENDRVLFACFTWFTAERGKRFELAHGWLEKTERPSPCLFHKLFGCASTYGALGVFSPVRRAIIPSPPIVEHDATIFFSQNTM